MKFWHFIFGRGTEAHHGLMDWVKNPNSSSPDLDAIRRLDSAKLSEQDIGAIVEGIFPPKTRSMSRSMLSKIGERAIPQLSQALMDPRIESVGAEGAHTFVGSPLQVISLLLSKFSLPAFADRAAVLARNGNRHTAELLASTGQDQHAAQIVQLSKSVEGGWVLKGIEHATNNDCLGPELQSLLFEQLRRRISDHQTKNSGLAFRVFEKIGGEAALHHLGKEEVYAVTNVDRHEILAVLCRADERVLNLQSTTKILEESLAKVESDEEQESGAANCLCSAMTLFGRISENEEKQVLQLAESPNPVIARAGTMALCRIKKVNPNSAFDRHKQVGEFSKLSTEQQYVYATMVCNGEIKNGGFHQYFVNSFGEFWVQAVEGFRRIGLEQHANLIHRAGLEFGESGPPVVYKKRRRALASFSEKQHKQLEYLDDTYWNMKLDINLALAKFALMHPEHFREIPSVV